MDAKRDGFTELVNALDACPECGERRSAYISQEDTHITCHTCGCKYEQED